MDGGSVAKGERDEPRSLDVASRTGQWGEAELNGVANGCELGDNSLQVPGKDHRGGHFNACSGGEHCQRSREDHRFMLLTCWYISSAARTTFEFAS